MNIPVLWVSRYPDILARGYADQGLLEAIFDHSLWRPPAAFHFSHYEIRHDEWGDDFADGAVVVLPSRHHVDDIGWFVEQLDKLAWSVVILCGDEEWVFPWAEVTETPTRKVWIMQPRPEHAHLSGLIPGGWYPQTHELLKDAERFNRPLDWFFAGQVRDNTRRQQLMRYLMRMHNGRLLATEGYMQGMPKSQYFTLMAQAKYVPGPSGPMTVDTARPLEALEAGCVPIVDCVTPRNETYDYWTLVFGEGHPLQLATNWASFRSHVNTYKRDWEESANTHFSWWQGWKRKIAHQLHDDIRQVSGVWAESDAPDDLITVIVTTSPTPIHPSTEHLEETIRSIREQLPVSEIIITCDGVHRKDEDLRAAYTTYLRRLTHLCNFEWDNVIPILSKEWVHQANTTRAALKLVTTPLVLFVEHDTPIVGDINWLDLCGIVIKDLATTVQLHFNESIHPDHEIHRCRSTIHYGDSSFIPWSAWWQRPHLSRTGFYERILRDHFPESCRTMIEDKLYGIVHSDFEDYGSAAWSIWRIVVYQPEGSMIRSRHLDSRQGAPKHEMAFE